MSGKVKMRCARCGKSFKASGSKQVLCPDCAAKERQQKSAARTSPVPQATSTPAVPQKPRVSGPGANILVPGSVPVVQAGSVPPDVGAFGVAAREAQRPHQSEAGRDQQRPGSPGSQRPVAAPHPRGGSQTVPAKRQPKEPKAPRPPKTPKTPRPPQPPFELSDEMRARVESRYLELASPVEFDGIRTQIAGELGVPKTAVKRAVSELRKRMQLPSWWELQAYSGSPEDLDRIRVAYVPLLPVPPIGVHRQIATELGLEPIQVYQGIRRIRAEMRLPQFNPLEAHQTEQPVNVPGAPASKTETAPMEA